MLTLDTNLPIFPAPLVRLPFAFDTERLQWEVDRIGSSDWISHPDRFIGNRAVVLVSAGGGRNNDFAISGPMCATPVLQRSPYLRQVLGTFGCPISRSRLMWLDAGARVPSHRDTAYHWFRRLRLHVPVRTSPSVTFTCGDTTVHMKAGEAWAFDHRHYHSVSNAGSEPRIHLVVDTKGTPDLRLAIESGGASGGECPTPYVRGYEPLLRFEPYLFEVLTPGEFERLAGVVVAGTPEAARGAVSEALYVAARDWAEIFWVAGHDAGGEPRYLAVLDHLHRAVGGTEFAQDAGHAWRVITRMLDTCSGTYARAPEPQPPSLQPRLDRAAHYRRSPQLLRATPRVMAVLSAFDRPRMVAEARAAGGFEALDEISFHNMVDSLRAMHLLNEDFGQLNIRRPVFVIAPPRAGAAALMDALRRCAGLWTISDKATRALSGVTGLHPRSRGWVSDSLADVDATSSVTALVADAIGRDLRDKNGSLLADLPSNSRPPFIRWLHADGANALRVPFLHRLFPDAHLVCVIREPVASVSSTIEAWRSGQFVTHPDLPGWSGFPWSLLLPPDWRSLANAPLAEIAARQWLAAADGIGEGLAAIPRDSWMAIDYDDLTRHTRPALMRILEFIGCELPLGLDVLPLSRFSLGAPDPDKWRKHAPFIDPYTQSLRDASRRLAALAGAA